MTALSQFRPPSIVEEDRTLALSLQAGDESAVRELYRRFGGLVFTVSMRVLGDRQRAEEATQQTFLQAWRHADRFEPGRDFAPWLATIARRAAIDLGRREARRPANSIEDTPADDAALSHHDPSAESIERVWAVRAAIEQLDADEQELVKLQHLEGLTHREISERLGVPIGTIKSRSFRAHRRLSQRLAHLREYEATQDESSGSENRTPSNDVGNEED